MKTANLTLRVVALIVWLAMATWPATARARGPEIAGLVPRGAQRGTEFTIELSGERLDEVRDVLFSRPGLEVVSFRATDDEQAKALLRANDDCPLGEHPFWLVGPNGVSNLATLRIGPFAVIEETEPNDDPSEVGNVALDLAANGLTLVGTLEGADIDCFAFELKAGDRLSAELEGMRLGGTFLDAHLELTDPTGQVVAANDDCPLLGQDPLVTYVAKTGGVYTLKVRDAAFDAEYDARYRLHVGHFARPVVCFPCGGRPGERLNATLLGDSRGEFSETIVLPSGKGFHEHYPTDSRNGPSPSPIRIRLADFDNVFEVEPNDTNESATPTGRSAAALNGVLSHRGDEDFFVLDVAKGGELAVEVFGTRVGSPIDAVLEVYSPAGVLVARNDDGSLHDSTLRFTANSGGNYTIGVRDHLQRGGPEFVYRVECGPINPALALNVASSKLEPRAKPAAIVVPQGGRTAALVSARRSNCDGPIEINVVGAPSDVAVWKETTSLSNHLSMVLLEADPHATLGASWLQLTGYCQSATGTVEGELTQSVGVVFGEPRQTIYHQVELRGVPLIVTKPAPVSIEVEPPAVAIAPDGALNLNVDVHRRTGNAGPITLSALRLPPWILVDEGQPEIGPNDSKGHFRLIADQRTEPGKYRMVLLATTNTDDGEVTVASRPFEIQVAEPHAKAMISAASAEQGTQVDLKCRVDWRHRPAARVTAHLRGLPKHATVPAIELVADETEITFPVQLGAECPASIHNTLYLELEMSHPDGESSEFSGRGGVLEVFSTGGRARDTLSPLERLRTKAASGGRQIATP